MKQMVYQKRDSKKHELQKKYIAFVVFSLTVLTSGCNNPFISKEEKLQYWLKTMKETAHCVNTFHGVDQLSIETRCSKKHKKAKAELVKIGRPAVKPLVSLLACDNKYHGNAVEILLLIKEPETMLQLIQSFDCKNGDSSFRIATGFDEAFGSKAIPLLMNGLRSENPGIREGCKATLRHYSFATAHIVRPEIFSELAPILIESLNDKNMFVRQTAAELLGRVEDAPGYTPAIPALIEMARSDESDALRIAAVLSLCTMNTGSATDDVLEIITEMLADSNLEMRRRAAEALNILNDWDKKESVLLALKDLDWGVRKSAVMALGRFDLDRDIHPILNGILTGDNNAFVRQQTAVTIGEMGDSCAPGEKCFGEQYHAPILVNAYDNEKDSTVRLSIVEAIGRKKFPEKTQVIRRIMNEDPDEKVREAARGILSN